MFAGAGLINNTFTLLVLLTSRMLREKMSHTARLYYVALACGDLDILIAMPLVRFLGTNSHLFGRLWHLLISLGDYLLDLQAMVCSQFRTARRTSTWIRSLTPGAKRGVTCSWPARASGTGRSCCSTASASSRSPPRCEHAASSASAACASRSPFFAASPPLWRSSQSMRTA